MKIKLAYGRQGLDIELPDEIGIVFNDITRPTPYDVIMPALLEQLDHVPDEGLRCLMPPAHTDPIPMPNFAGCSPTGSWTNTGSCKTTVTTAIHTRC